MAKQLTYNDLELTPEIRMLKDDSAEYADRLYLGRMTYGYRPINNIECIKYFRELHDGFYDKIIDIYKELATATAPVAVATAREFNTGNLICLITKLLEPKDNINDYDNDMEEWDWSRFDGAQMPNIKDYHLDDFSNDFLQYIITKYEITRDEMNSIMMWVPQDCDNSKCIHFPVMRDIVPQHDGGFCCADFIETLLDNYEYYDATFSTKFAGFCAIEPSMTASTSANSLATAIAAEEAVITNANKASTTAKTATEIARNVTAAGESAATAAASETVTSAAANTTT
jgi:hypothetical protein